MRPYQLQGLNWMISLHHNGLNGILADEMVKQYDNRHLSYLIFLIGSWENTANDFIPWLPKTHYESWCTTPHCRTKEYSGQLASRVPTMDTRF